MADSYITKHTWKDRVIRNRNIVNDYKKEHPCVICGESRLVCLDFHHVSEEKIATINVMVDKHASKKKLLAEIEKCDVLCANCHRVIHWENRPPT